MKRKGLIAIVAAIVFLGGFFLLYKRLSAPTTPFSPSPITANDKNATYMIDGSSVTLVDGYAESEVAPGSASKLVTQYFGNEATGDLTGDGTADAAFLITQTGGGSGTFYYIVAAIGTADGYQGTNGILLGDRIAPQSTEIKDGEVIVNYADRGLNEPMTAQPSVGVSRYFRVEGGALVEVGN